MPVPRGPTPIRRQVTMSRADFASRFGWRPWQEEGSEAWKKDLGTRDNYYYYYYYLFLLLLLLLLLLLVVVAVSNYY